MAQRKLNNGIAATQRNVIASCQRKITRGAQQQRVRAYGARGIGGAIAARKAYGMAA